MNTSDVKQAIQSCVEHAVLSQLFINQLREHYRTLKPVEKLALLSLGYTALIETTKAMTQPCICPKCVQARKRAHLNLVPESEAPDVRS